MSVLTVWLGSEHVADLEQTRRGELRLRYTQQAMETHGRGSVVLSVALPVERRHHGRPVELWAESVLPEGEARTGVEDRFGVRRGDTFGLLMAIGADCAGAVAFSDPEHRPSTDVSKGPPLTTKQIAEAVADLPIHPLGVDEDVRVSLGGLRAKLLLVRRPDGRWSRPVGGAPSTHIAKPDPTAFPGLVAAEAFTLALSAGVDIPTSRFELRTDWGESPVLVLERYDRVVADGSVTRIHQEDGCAVLGVNPSGRHKYQSLDAAGPSWARLAGVLARHGTRRQDDLTALTRALVLRVAVGDVDGHARNIAFLHRGSAVELAPVYDAGPTSRFVTGRTVGLWVAGQSRLPFIGRSQLVQEAQSWGMPARRASQVVTQTLERLRAGVAAAHEAVPAAAPEVVDAVHERILRLSGGS